MMPDREQKKKIRRLNLLQKFPGNLELRPCIFPVI
jgi:hypothetical protein